MNNARENRRSFRVSESVYLKFETLTEEEFQKGINHHNLQVTNDDGAQSMLVDIDARLSEAMYLLSGESAALGRCITLINDKLNIVINQSPGLRQSKSALAQTPPQTCDVGADGIVFSSAQALKTGDKLYLQFLLSTDNRYVETFCRVVRLTDPPDSSDAGRVYGIAVEFVDMQPAQREILIQHMFTREGETLRMRRLEVESEKDFN